MSISKSALRSSARQLRETVASQYPAAANDLAAVFPVKLLERFGPDVAGYLAIGSELNPAPLLDRLKALGANICLPRVEADDTMTFRRVASPEDLTPGPFGLTQPSEAAEIAHPTLVLTPLLAFDADGNRLGYGKGHYDRALAGLRENGRVFVCGLAFPEQEVLSVPTEATDIPLDWVVTTERSIPLFLARAASRKS